VQYLKRNLEVELVNLFKVFPIISIMGPRQAGKSTLIKHWIAEQKEDWEYITFDNREIFTQAKRDPDLFVKSLKQFVAIDEVQKVPDLFHSIKFLVDEDPTRKIILSGSANFLLMKNITESLAGRVGVLQLLPFSFSESKSIDSNYIIKKIINSSSIDTFCKEIQKLKSVNEQELFHFMLRGGFPRLYQNDDIPVRRVYESYISTYIERDLRDFSQISNLEAFQQTYKMLAFQTASLINISNIANDLGVDQKTIRNYLSILETSYQCKKISPYLFNPKKRLVKSPKIFFYDTGLVNYFHGNDNVEMMLNRGSWGNILETFAFSELYKQIKDIDCSLGFNFWRTSNGAEVDFILELGQRLIPIEIKSASQIYPNELRGLSSFMETYPQHEIPFGIVFHRAQRVSFLKENIIGIPINMLF